MGTLIDSSILIAVERGHLKLEDLLAGRMDEDFAVSAVTASELLHGPVFPFDLLTARIHARLAAELSARRVSVGPHDLMIAATAVARGYNVATRDERSFPKIPGLSLLKW